MRVWVDLTNSPHVLVMRPVIRALEAEHPALVTPASPTQRVGGTPQGRFEPAIAFGRHAEDVHCETAMDLLQRGFEVAEGVLAPGGDLFVAAPATVQERGATAELLPAADDHVAVLRVELDQPRLATRLLAGDQGRAGPAERVQHDVAGLRGFLGYAGDHIAH